jgi:hypothetical protein
MVRPVLYVATMILPLARELHVFIWDLVVAKLGEELRALLGVDFEFASLERVTPRRYKRARSRRAPGHHWTWT